MGKQSLGEKSESAAQNPFLEIIIISASSSNV